MVGTIEAPTTEAASNILTERNLIIVSLEPAKKISFFGAPLKFLTRIKRREIVIFSRQLSVLVSATLPLVQALRILIKETSNFNLRIIISEIADEVDGGAKLSATFSKYPHVFNDFYINMVKTGETSGKLDEVLTYLANQQEKDYYLMNKIKGTMIYPVFIINSLVLVGGIMMVFVVPQLTKILKEAGIELPFATRLLINVSDFLSHYWWLLLISLVVIFIIFKIYSKTEIGRRQFDFFRTKIPIFGSLFQKIYLVRFSQSLSTLLTSGVSLTLALRVVADVVGNAVYKDLILKTVKEVEAGNPIDTVFSKSAIIPSMVTQMMTIGERTGYLDSILEKIANFFSQEIDNTMVDLISIIEPLFIIGIGIGVGLMVAAIILPLYNLAAVF